MATAILVRNCNIPNDNAPAYAILQSDLTTIGRHGGVRMDTSRGKEVSKVHTKIHRKINGDQVLWIVEDNKSLNGTFVNGRKVRCVALKNHDEIVFGGGPAFSVGDRIISTDLAECRYIFYITPPPVHYRADINMLHTDSSVSSELCPICYSPITGCETLPCGHSFCFTCLQEWSHSCAKKMRPCLCPMCRAQFSSSELDAKEYSLTPHELRISFIEPLLNLLDISCCKDIRKRNIFHLWDEKQKQWFWDSYNLVKGIDARKFPFLDLTRASYKYIIAANESQLTNAIVNLEGVPQDNKENMMVEVLRLVYSKFTAKPETKKLRSIRSSKANLWW
ncbi:FHA domain containing protein [Tritrichomonas foetus]|uniref:E3 ubiquitin-protein ligase CHFR n=1 Tax=Tritrichomonas foetus TaxID=1144522 RepID=A0A1J4KNX6_9EUKA|nr:FHA domain containing protein [Tritrichomonas foetus]|eukprot:OHT11406.1 FHA domain containing protein [Tritrichomonas foetus]